MDLSKIDSDFKKEIIRGGEGYLTGQPTIATSADARASGLAGSFTAVATALAAGVIAVMFHPDWTIPERLALGLGGGIAAALFIAGSVLCVISISPKPFWLPGCEPGNWDEDTAVGRALDDCLGQRAQHIQEQIVENNALIEKNARLFKWGARLGIVAPFVGVSVWLLVSACRWIS